MTPLEERFKRGQGLFFEAFDDAGEKKVTYHADLGISFHAVITANHGGA